MYVEYLYIFSAQLPHEANGWRKLLSDARQQYSSSRQSPRHCQVYGWIVIWCLFIISYLNVQVEKKLFGDAARPSSQSRVVRNLWENHDHQLKTMFKVSLDQEWRKYNGLNIRMRKRLPRNFQVWSRIILSKVRILTLEAICSIICQERRKGVLRNSSSYNVS